MSTFGEKLKAIREQVGITQAQLAEMSGIPLGSVREYEQSSREPSLFKAGRLARVLGQPLEAFLPDDLGMAAAQARPRKANAGQSKRPATAKGKRK